MRANECFTCGKRPGECSCVSSLNKHPDLHGGQSVYETALMLPSGIEIRLDRDMALNPPAVRVAIVLPERTATQAVKDAVPPAIEWNKALMLLQGPDPGLNERARVLDELDIAYSKDGSYPRLAERLNEEITDSVLAWCQATNVLTPLGDRTLDPLGGG